jgi:hypothetical protein
MMLSGNFVIQTCYKLRLPFVAMAKRRRRSKYGTFIRIQFNTKSKIDQFIRGKESYSDTIYRVFSKAKRGW